jgi:acetone carboxylase alpha subunit
MPAISTSVKKKVAGITWGHESLASHRVSLLERTAETGYYNGLEQLPLKEAEPIAFERMFAKLRSGVVDARETSKKIAASPIVEQEGELCFTLYNAAGDCVVTSTGIIIHVGTMGAAIKYMIVNGWEENPGIEDGDIFCNNDCAIGNVHPCDVMTIVPIFHVGMLVGWAAGVTHVIDTGAVSPGSMAVGQTQRFGDGYQITCRKVGIQDRLSRDWLHESQRMVRTTRFWILDERTRVAGCHKIRTMLEEAIDEEGLEAWEAFSYEVVEDGRRGLQKRLRSLCVPGKTRQVAFVDVPYSHPDVNLVQPYAEINTIMHAPSTIEIKPDASWTLDFEGSSRWGWHSFNCHQVSFTSGIWVMMTQTLIPTERINDGAYYGTHFRLPKGTWMNPDDRRTAHAYAWHFLVSGWSPLWRGLSRTYFARGYMEEVNAGNANTCNWLQGGGINQDGQIHSVNSFECAAVGVGASAVRDGVNHGAAIWNPEGDMGDMEIWELAEPLLYLGRNLKMDTGGAGKYRGGAGFESLRMVHQAKDWTMYFMGNGRITSDCGLMGGYPSSAGYRFEAHKTGLIEAIAQGRPLPLGPDFDPDNPEYEKTLPKGAIVKRDQQCVTTEAVFEEGDLYLNYMRGGPGFGDPLDRAASLVEDDLNNFRVSPRLAEQVCGVVMSKNGDGSWHVDGGEATAERRAQIKQERIARAEPTRTWMKRERQRVLGKEASFQVKQMFASSFGLSHKFLGEFKEFWELPDDWELTEEELHRELGIAVFGATRDTREELSTLPDVHPVDFSMVVEEE